MNRDQYEYLQNLVYRISGNILETGKEYLVEIRLFPLAKELGLDSVSDLLDKIQSGLAEPMKERVVEAMTINETFFFRDEYPFHILEEILLPQLIQEKANSIVKELNIWSGACSTGQEIYSIAMLIHHRFPQLLDWKINLFASDFAQHPLEKAKKGEFNYLEVHRGLPEEFRNKYFSENKDIWTIDDSIRNMVSFYRMNLVEEWTFMPKMDIIFLRNVLIYFNQDTRLQILEKLAQGLVPTGILFLGGAESTLHLSQKFEIKLFKRNSYYQLKSNSASCSTPNNFQIKTTTLDRS